VKRDKLIAEIRMINKKLVSKYNVFDKSSTSYFLLEVGFGLLEEMSLLDLQAKLTEVKAEKKKIQTLKRAQIQGEKQSRLHMLDEKISFIQSVREEQKKSRA